MNLAIWVNLFWKEWREHQWKLAALATILFGTFVAIWLIDRGQGYKSAVFIVLIFYTPLASLFIGMGLAAGEHARGTVGFLQRLPATPKRAAIAKLLVGYATILLPVLSLVAFCGMARAMGWTALLGNRGALPIGLLGTGPWWLEIVTLAATATASLLAWTIAGGVNRATELRAGVVALIVTVGIWCLFFAAAKAMQPTYEKGRIYTGDEVAATEKPYQAKIARLSAPLPAGMILAGDFATRMTTTQQLSVWLIFSIAHGSLILWWVFRYASYPSAAKQATMLSPVRGGEKEWLRPPRRSPFEAILWKQVREAAPIIAGVLALAVGWTFVLWLNEGNRSADPTDDWLSVLASAMTMCGYLAALLVGIGSFQDDLNPAISTFWRSRPIPPSLYYWLKYAGGFATLAVVFGGAFALAYRLDTPDLYFESRYVVPGIIVFWLTYATAVCLACLVRQAVYAGILALIPVGYGMAIAFTDEWPLWWLARVVVLILTSVAITVLGWRSMRNDWAIGR